MGGRGEETDGVSLRAGLEIYDANFEERLSSDDFPAVRLVRSREPFTNYKCGFIHAITGDKIVMSVTGECLYDDDTGEFLGGICWCKDLKEYSDYLLEVQERTLHSHETICNLMPHLVWTTTPSGQVDWYSQRVGRMYFIEIMETDYLSGMILQE